MYPGLKCMSIEGLFLEGEAQGGSLASFRMRGFYRYLDPGKQKSSGV
jgi:hypothetical protein